MTYEQRLVEYENEKQKLKRENLSSKEFEKRLKELAKKWKI